MVCSRATHHFTCIHRCCVLAAAKQCRGEARLERCGLPPFVATSWACAISPTTVCFTHTEPTHRTHPTDKRQAAAGSLTRSTLAACRHEPLSESARRSPWLPPTAPVPPPRFACFVSGSDRGYTTRLHLAAWVALFAHASVRLAWLRQRHPARRIGSLFAQAPSSGRHAPCRNSGRRASPRSTSAAMAAANSVSRAPSARFSFVTVACGRRPLPGSGPAMVAVFGRGCRCAVVRPGCHGRRQRHPVPPPASLSLLRSRVSAAREWRRDLPAQAIRRPVACWRGRSAVGQLLRLCECSGCAA